MRRNRMVLVVCSLLLAGGAVAPGKSPAQQAGACAAPQHRQFDFWVGDWDVRTPEGKLAGTNRIERILDGCVLQESWAGTRGMRGTSLNMYSAGDRRWHQTWMDSNGLLLELTGGLENEKMVMTGETLDANGRPLVNRVTWEQLEDGRVRQHWETSADSGRTWQDAFVGLYQRRPGAGGSR